MGSTMQVLRDYGNISRLEYTPAEAPALLVPLFLGTATVAGLLNLHWIEAVLAFILLYTSGFIINSYNDIEVDLRFKTRVASAAQRWGRKRLLQLFVVQITLAIVLVVHLSWILNAWFILGITLLGVFMATAYSIPPLHFKVRGIWHIISLSLSAFIIPFIFFFYVVMQTLTVPIVILLVGFAIAHYGIALANQTGDYLEDKAEGLTTPAVKWGLDNTLKLAKAMTMTGVAIELIGILGFILTAPWLVSFEASLSFLPFPAGYLLFTMIAILVVIGYSVPTRGLFSLHEISSAKQSIKKRMDRIKDRMNYPKWQASGIVSLALSSMALFSLAVLF